MIDAQGPLRLMFDTVDAYDRADFDARPTAGGTGGGVDGDPVGWLIDGSGQRSSDAALAASRSLSPITVAPELIGRGAVGPQVASRLNSRK